MERIFLRATDGLATAAIKHFIAKKYILSLKLFHVDSKGPTLAHQMLFMLRIIPRDQIDILIGYSKAIRLASEWNKLKTIKYI